MQRFGSKVAVRGIVYIDQIFTLSVNFKRSQETLNNGLKKKKIQKKYLKKNNKVRTIQYPIRVKTAVFYPTKVKNAA